MKKRFILSALAGVMLSIGSSGLVLADENEDTGNLEEDTSELLRNNHTDSNWDFNLPRLQGNMYTNSRMKKDKSRSYAKATAIGKGKIAVWTERANGGNINTSEYILKQGQSAKIYNRAYEMYGKTNIKLGVKTAGLE
ncbi:hypothetical protein EQ500_10375, partial [Lactobacillus sp. XV13L]|nr:hypothetical protein [Lactobacillus sp. XV13L]